MIGLGLFGIALIWLDICLLMQGRWLWSGMALIVIAMLAMMFGSNK